MGKLEHHAKYLFDQKQARDAAKSGPFCYIIQWEELTTQEKQLYMDVVTDSLAWMKLYG